MAIFQKGIREGLAKAPRKHNGNDSNSTRLLHPIRPQNRGIITKNDRDESARLARCKVLRASTLQVLQIYENAHTKTCTGTAKVTISLQPYL